MNKVLKFSTRNGSNVWFTSDSHYDHAREFLLNPRGFPNDLEGHNKWLVESYNKVVGINDIVFHLGDVSLASSQERTESFLNSLNGRIYKIWGNHTSFTRRIYRDELAKQFSRSDVEVYPLTWNGKVTFIGTQAKIVVDNQMIILGHFGLRVWEEAHRGSWNLSGHSHSNDVGRNPENPIAKALDVGVDNFRRPISFEEVKIIMSRKSVECLDHHRN